jgi:hypothetical protein
VPRRHLPLPSSLPAAAAALVLAAAAGVCAALGLRRMEVPSIYKWGSGRGDGCDFGLGFAFLRWAYMG